ncbi:MAG: AI-2E family transporter [Steroidobacteraceae bacterium]
MGLLAAGLIICALYFGRDILMPLALAFLLGFLLDPLVVRLRRMRIPRIVAVVIVVGLALGALGVAGAFLTSQVRSLSAQLPTYQANIQTKVRNFRHSLEKPGMLDGAVRAIDTVKKEVEEAAPAAGQSVADSNRRVQRVEVVATPPSPLERASRGLTAVSGPLAQAGIVLVFVFLILLDRQDLRDRLLRLVGGNLHRTTDAMDEAGERIGKYLIMQLLVNLSYGFPMAAGLWLIGVPGAALWGALAAVLRFLPYIGPMISAVFPLALAFAVDPGWSMVLWTLGLILTLELVSNNVIEPWMYGASTGLSAMSLIVSATFWAAIWGPMGLVMSTPLTVCLLVIGRHLPQLKFFDVLLGSQAALDLPTRLYQRLLAGDVEEAIELAAQRVEAESVDSFYHHVAIPALRLASSDHDRVSTAEHRHRVVTGTDRLIEELRDLHPSTAGSRMPRVIFLGGKWEIDTLAARMLSHGLSLSGVAADHRAADIGAADFFSRLDLAGAKVVCLSHFSPEPQTQVRYLCRRLRKRWPDLHIVLSAWNAPPELLDQAACQSLGVDAIAVSYEETQLRLNHYLGTELDATYLPAPIPAADFDRVRALRASGALDGKARAQFDSAAKRAADIFDVPLALVTLIDDETQIVCGAGGSGEGAGKGAAIEPSSLSIPRSLSMCGHVVASGQTLVVEDIARDPRFANNPALQANGLRFYAGAPFGESGHVFGTLCILDTRPRSLSESEIRLLVTMAQDVGNSLRLGRSQLKPVEVQDAAPAPPEGDLPSATVGQLVPGR